MILQCWKPLEAVVTTCPTTLWISVRVHTLKAGWLVHQNPSLESSETHCRLCRRAGHWIPVQTVSALHHRGTTHCFAVRLPVQGELNAWLLQLQNATSVLQVHKWEIVEIWWLHFYKMFKSPHARSCQLLSALFQVLQVCNSMQMQRCYF